VVADENGNFQTSWYVFSEEFLGATFQATATGETSGLTASARFTDAAFNYSPTTNQSLSAAAGGPAVSFVQDVISSQGTAFTANVQVAGTGPNPIPSGWVSTVPSPLTFTGATNPETRTWTVFFTVPFGTTAGTYTANIKANASIPGVGVGAGTPVTLTVTANQPPVALCHNVTVSTGTTNCTATASIDNGSNDPDPGDTITLSQSPPGPYSLGNTSVTLTVTDNHGASGTCSATVTVQDTTAPVTLVLPDVTGQCSATIGAAPTTTDNCAGTVTGTTSDSLTRNTQGTSVVHWTFDDGNGNSTMATQNIVVDDTNAPVPDAASLPDATGECSATISAPPTATDNCSGAITGTTSDSLTRSTQGTSVVTWHFNDGNGNESTQTQNIVVHDTTAPATPVLPDVTGECSATIAAAPTTTDNCAGTVTGTTSDSLTRSTQGTSVVTWHFNDGNGNSTTATQNIVVHDTTAPATPVLPDVTGQCSATISAAPTTTDNCAGTVIGTTSDSLTRTTQGTSVVHWTFNDGNGNTTMATQNIVVHDTIAPVFTCPPDRPITATCPTTVPNLTSEVHATDNCGGAVTVTQTPAAGTPLALGATTVTLHVTDAVGNESTCQTVLTVSYGFNGFFPPVDNIPVINRVKAGSAIPVKFSLGCNQGLNIFWAGYPQSGQMNCNTQLPEDDIEQTVNAGGSSLNYDPVANQYIYVWKTDRSWAGTCRQLTVRFADGTYQYAFFNFTR
jgi:HYR domain